MWIFVYFSPDAHCSFVLRDFISRSYNILFTAVHLFDR